MTLDPMFCVRLFLLATCLFLSILAVLTYRRRSEAPQAPAFCALLVACAIYGFGYSGELAQTTLPAAYRWLEFENLALPWFPALWLLAALKHNRSQFPALPLFALPAIAFVALDTNRWHGLFYKSIVMVAHGPFQVMSVDRGPIALLQDLYLFAAFILGLGLYARSYWASDGVFRRQSLLLLFSSSVPIGCYFVFLFGLTPWHIDISPITMALSGILYYFALFGFGTFDTAPLTRRLIFSSMRDAVLVLDTHFRLLDFNPAAQTFLPTLSKKHLGQPAHHVFAAYDGLLRSLTSAATTEINLTGPTGPRSRQLQDRSVEVRSFPLVARNRTIGYAAILADMTAQTLLREQLRLHAETDPLTGIANRRLFDQALERECKRADRYNLSFSLLLIDFDHFKLINDKFGHPAGDEVLRTLARRIRERVRESDLLARYGGEEFAILLVETPLEQAYILAEHIRAAVQDEPFVLSTMQLPVTVSIGLATRAPGDLTSPVALMKQADLALYQAKAHGRNQTAVAQNPHQTQPA